MAKKIIKARMQQRQDTLAGWAGENPVLLKGELGLVSDDPNAYKVGDGVTAWNDLPMRGWDGNIAQTTGDSTTAVMSQKAVTEGLDGLDQRVTNVSIQANRLELMKVTVVPGKGLSTNDYSNAEKQKLAGLQNYDDTELRAQVAQKADRSELTELSSEIEYLQPFKIPFAKIGYTDITLKYPLQEGMTIVDAVGATEKISARRSDNSVFQIKTLPYVVEDTIIALQSESTNGYFLIDTLAKTKLDKVESDLVNLRGIDEYLSQNAIIEGKADNPNEGDLAVENGTLHQYSRSSKEYDAKYKAVIGTSANDKEFVFQPNYRYDGLNKLDGQSNALGIVEYIPVRFEQAVFGEADADGNRWAEEFQISFYFNESGRVGNVNQLIAFFDADKNHIIGSWYFGNAMRADDKKYLCTESVISADEAIAEADDATRIYKNTMNLAKTTDGSSKWGIDANGNLIGTLANVRYIGYGMTYSTARGHSIMLNNEYRQVEGWENTRKTINGLVASEINFGKVRMWLTQDAEGNVLNISTEL